MKDLQKLLLPFLLVTGPLARANHSWKSLEGGCEAKASPTPYLAYLQGKGNNFCAGFLVAPNWVMTSAQCFIYKPLTVILGAHTIQKSKETWQMFEVLEYYRYPEYTIPKKGKDILLLKLKGNATSNEHVRTIPFEKSKVASRTKCSIVSWDHKMPNSTSHTVPVSIISPRDCINLYPGLADNLICGLSKSTGLPVKSDAGAPLICNNKAYGIFSYKHNNWPGFYTRIAAYLFWVDSVMKSA